jgi:hypothetical protein
MFFKLKKNNNNKKIKEDESCLLFFFFLLLLFKIWITKANGKDNRWVNCQLPNHN